MSRIFALLLVIQMSMLGSRIRLLCYNSTAAALSLHSLPDLSRVILQANEGTFDEQDLIQFIVEAKMAQWEAEEGWSAASRNPVQQSFVT